MAPRRSASEKAKAKPTKPAAAAPVGSKPSSATSPPSPSVFGPLLHRRFRTAVRKIRTQRSPRFFKNRRAYVLRGRTFRGAHGVLQRAFGPLSAMISAGGGCEGNQTRSKTSTSRGSRIGKELVRLAAKPTTPAPKASAKASKREPFAPHVWTPAVAAALQRWGVYLIDGEVPVCRRHVATGIDLLGVCRDPADPHKWQLVCVELKTGYKGPVWQAARLGKTLLGGHVHRTILNYALTQAQLTHDCATTTFKEYDFAPPMVVLVNDYGVKRFRPDEHVRAQTAALWASCE